jgi:hypothetical protein
MNTLEKLEALKAGEPDTEYGEGVSSNGVWLLKNGEAMDINEIISDLQTNAAKVEVAKAVVGDLNMLITDNLGRRHADLVAANRQALTLLNKLKEVL